MKRIERLKWDDGFILESKIVDKINEIIDVINYEHGNSKHPDFIKNKVSPFDHQTHYNDGKEELQ